MNKRGQSGSELRVQEKGRMIVQRREFANYLRKNSGVKGDATSSEIQLLQSDFSPFECSVVLFASIVARRMVRSQ